MKPQKKRKKRNYKLLVSFFDVMIILALNFVLILLGHTLAQSPNNLFWIYLLPLIIVLETYIISSMDIINAYNIYPKTKKKSAEGDDLDEIDS